LIYESNVEESQQSSVAPKEILTSEDGSVTPTDAPLTEVEDLTAESVSLTTVPPYMKFGVCVLPNCAPCFGLDCSTSPIPSIVSTPTAGPDVATSTEASPDIKQAAEATIAPETLDKAEEAQGAITESHETMSSTTTETPSSSAIRPFATGLRSGNWIQTVTVTALNGNQTIRICTRFGCTRIPVSIEDEEEDD
jgi:hypothetical protein